MNPKYKHQKIQAMITWNAKALTFIQILNTWKTTHGDTIRQKAVFDMQPTYPELDIQPTGKCKVWIREINQITQVARTIALRIDTEIPISPTNMPHFHKSQILQGLVCTTLMKNVLVC